MSSSEEENAEITQTWNKFASSARKIGYGDGATTGRNVTFQKSFDEGYIHGFKTGYAIGTCKGIIRVKTMQDKDSETDAQFENSRRGACQLCEDKSLMQKNTNDIINTQTEFSNNLLKEIHCKYSSYIKPTLLQTEI